MVDSRRVVNLHTIGLKKKLLYKRPLRELKLNKRNKSKSLRRGSSKKSIYLSKINIYHPNSAKSSLSSKKIIRRQPKASKKNFSSSIVRKYRPNSAKNSLSYSVHKSYRPKPATKRNRKSISSHTFSRASSRFLTNIRPTFDPRRSLTTSRYSSSIRSISSPSSSPSRFTNVRPTFIPRRNLPTSSSPSIKQKRKFAKSSTIHLRNPNSTFKPKKRIISSPSLKLKNKSNSVHLKTINPTFKPIKNSKKSLSVRPKQKIKKITKIVSDSILTGTNTEKEIGIYFKNKINLAFAKYQKALPIKYITFYLLHNSVKIVIDNKLSFILKDKLAIFKETFLYELVIYFVLTSIEKTGVQISIKTYKKLQNNLINRIVENIKSVNQKFIEYEMITFKSELLHRYGSKRKSKSRISSRLPREHNVSRKHRGDSLRRKQILSKNFDDIFNDHSGASLRKRKSRFTKYKSGISKRRLSKKRNVSKKHRGSRKRKSRSPRKSNFQKMKFKIHSF